jgi:hypothetical protein
MMGFTNGAGTDNPSVAPEFTPVIIGVPFVPSLVFCVVFCRYCTFVLFPWYLQTFLNQLQTRYYRIWRGVLDATLCDKVCQ